MDSIIVELIGVILPIVAAILGYVFGGTRISRTRNQQPPNHSDRLKTLITTLASASTHVDEIVAELSESAMERQQALVTLERELSGLEEREHLARKRVSDLENIPLPVAEHFAALLSTGEGRSRRRDYLLFGLGVVVSSIISIALRLSGLG